MTDQPDLRLTRRAFLGIIAAAGATACSGAITVERTESESARTAAPSTPSRSEQPVRSEVPEASEAAGAGYEPIAGETYSNAKRVAGRFAEALLTYEAARRPRDLLRGALRGVDETLDVASLEGRAERLLVRGATSRGAAVYPQLGGLTIGSGTDRASVMVVIAQHLSGGGNAKTVTRTLDVRLIRRGDVWRVEELADAGGAPVERAVEDLPDLAQRVLSEARIELPDSARWDIMAGSIDGRLLTTMLDLAGVAPYSVAVLKSGHPRNVFGTDKISGHTLGRGMDIWQVAGRPVVLQGPSTQSDAHAFTTSALEEFDVPELGSPWDLDGPPEPGKVKPSFTDAVHADHIHVAFKAA